MEEDIKFIMERHGLCVERIREIAKAQEVPEKYRDYFKKEAEFILKTMELSELVKAGGYAKLSMEELEQWNEALYAKIVRENYEESYANPEYAVKCFDMREGRVLSALSAKLMELIGYAMKQKTYFQTILMELFLEVYVRYEEYDEFAWKDAKAAFKSFSMDYRRDYMEENVKERYLPERSAVRKVIESDLTDLRYLYQYGEYITDNEKKIAEFLSRMPQEEIDAMAETYVSGYIRGFETMGVVRKENGVAVLIYPVGFERMMDSAIRKFEQNGVRVVLRQSLAESANRQFDYDHRQDYGLGLDRVYVNRYLEDMAAVYEENKEILAQYIGPAVIETFGEADFEPVNKKAAVTLDKRQIKLDREMNQKYAGTAYTYVKSDETSFTIIAYPIPAIGEQFDEIFAETVRCNTLSNDEYTKIQQAPVMVVRSSVQTAMRPI